MIDRLTGSAGRSILAQTGFVVFLIVSVVVALALGPFDIFVFASLVVAIPFVVMIWFSMKRKPWAYLASSVLSLGLLLITPWTLTSTTDSILTFVTAFSAFLMVMVIYEGIVAYAESRRTSSPGQSA